MIFDISCAIVALSFFTLVVFAVWLLVALKKTLKTADQALKKLDSALLPLTHETTRLLKSSCAITENALEKVEALDPLFHSISSIGQWAENATDEWAPERPPKKIDSIFKQEREREERGSVNVLEWVEWAALGWILWQKLKKRSDK